MNRYSPAIMRRIVERAAAERGISVDRMLARTRGSAHDREAKAARIAAIKAARARGYPWAHIGKGLAGRDHSTVIHAVRGL